MAGKGVELLVSPTEDNGKILAAISGVRVGGIADFLVSLQIASLALQHRKNTNGGKRIVAFVGSPIESSPQDLQRIAKQLQKNNVAIDVVSMGETEANTEILTNFVNSVSSNDNSSLIVIGAGCERPLDEIMRSSSLGRGGDMGGGTVGGGGFGGNGDLDFDESMDPELAMAIRISQEESRAAAEAQAAQTASDSGAATGAEAGMDFPTTMTDGGDDAMDEEERLMQQALAMSMQASGGEADLPAPPNQESRDDSAEVAAMERALGGGDDDDEDDDDDADMAAALALSMQSAQPPQAPASGDSGNANSGFVDPDFVREMLGQVSDDLDPDDPLIAAALAQIASQNNNEEKDDSKKRKDPDSK